MAVAASAWLIGPVALSPAAGAFPLATGCSEEAGRSPSGGIHFNSPFHHEECEFALAESYRQMEGGTASRRWQRIRAEALLCIGLASDDPLVLRRAAAAFHCHLRARPDDLHARIGLADALRRLFPASEEGAIALVKALDALPADAPSLRCYLTSNLAAVRVGQETCPMQRAEVEREGSSAPLCIEDGQQSIEVALDKLDCAAARPGAGVRRTLERAELLRRAGRVAEALDILLEARAGTEEQRHHSAAVIAELEDGIATLQEFLRRDRDLSKSEAMLPMWMNGSCGP